MKKQLYIILAILCSVFIKTLAQSDLPVTDKPKDWITDNAKVFSNQEKAQLSRKLNIFEYNHDCQVYLITINENNGYPASMLASMIGEKWQVGQKGKDNGMIILMDMKERDVFIATGYGLEEYIPDAIAKRIVEKEIVPAFKQGNFFGGIDAATDVMISLLEGKFTPDEYREHTSSSGNGDAIGGIIFMIMMFAIFFGGGRRRSYGTGSRSNLPFWLALGMMSGNRSSGSFGNFSSGSGSFGSSGGFGGFSGGGGGSFGGGGAGGSW